MNSGERWLPVVGWELYEVSDYGRVRRAAPGVCTFAGKVLKPGTMKAYGHRYVNLRKDGQTSTVTVHRLVLTAFVGTRPEGMECRHLDGNPSNNRLENLKWGTSAENKADMARHGRIGLARGERSGSAKLTAAQVTAMRNSYARGGVTQRALAERFGISRTQTRCIVRGVWWRHLPLPTALASRPRHVQPELVFDEPTAIPAHSEPPPVGPRAPRRRAPAGT